MLTGVKGIAILRYLFGRTPSVDHVCFDHMAGRVAVLDFDGFVASLETGRSSSRTWEESTEIFFADGRLTLRTPPPLLKNVPARVELYRAGKVQEVSSPRCEWSWSFRRQAQAFVSDVLEDRVSINAGADALEDTALIEQMWRFQIARGGGDTPRAE